VPSIHDLEAALGTRTGLSRSEERTINRLLSLTAEDAEDVPWDAMQRQEAEEVGLGGYESEERQMSIPLHQTSDTRIAESKPKLKITKHQLKQIIKEKLHKLLEQERYRPGARVASAAERPSTRTSAGNWPGQPPEQSWEVEGEESELTENPPMTMPTDEEFAAALKVARKPPPLKLRSLDDLLFADEQKSTAPTPLGDLLDAWAAEEARTSISNIPPKGQRGEVPR
jgi:hypothetical protein